MAGDATGSVMRAGDVGRAARRDLQFRIPRRPVVRLGLRARPEETGWIIDGARKSQVLGGAFAREHMGPLLQACDGTRTLDEIGEVTGIGPQAAFEAVSLLWTGGIVEEGDTEPAPGNPAPELARFLSRLGDSTGVNDSWQDAARRLAAARVAVVGDAELAGEMVAALEPTLPEVRLDSAPRRGDTLTVLVETADSVARSQEVARRCRQEGIALLRVRAEQEAVTVGPYVDETFSPCLACASADEPELGPRPEVARRDIVIGLAAVIIGENLLPAKRIFPITLSAVLGSIVYRLMIAFALGNEQLQSIGVRPTDLNLITAVLVVFALQLPAVKRRLKILQSLQRLFRLAVHCHIWQRKRRAAQLGMNLRIAFQAA